MTDNLYSQLPAGAGLADELVEILAQNKQIRIERIVSTGQSSPEGFWYDCDEAEWVVVLKGEAELMFADDRQSLRMRPGDHVTIPAHKKHRVQWTTSDEPTIWLAVFYSQCEAESSE
jgi:cupin 2 domain-containing protein